MRGSAPRLAADALRRTFRVEPLKAGRVASGPSMLIVVSEENRVPHGKRSPEEGSSRDNGPEENTT
jgi:hypothetical protein